MNVKLLNKVAKHISEEPKRLNMFIVLENAAEWFAGDPDQRPPCGTIGCIAGWACFLSGEATVRESGGGWKRGRDLLGLDEEQSNRLFNPPMVAPDDPSDEWPVKFAEAYLKAKTPAGRAKATVARINHFIKTKGAE